MQKDFFYIKQKTLKTCYQQSYFVSFLFLQRASMKEGTFYIYRYRNKDLNDKHFTKKILIICPFYLKFCRSYHPH